MSIMDIIYTPVWVWPLFAFLVLSGITALRPRKARPARMLLLPVLFFVWGLYAIFLKLPGWPIALGVFVVGLALGFGVGWLLASRYPAATYDHEAKRILRPGTPLTLILIMIAFITKYGITSGLISGAFWGIMALQLLQAFNYIGPGAHPPA